MENKTVLFAILDKETGRVVSKTRAYMTLGKARQWFSWLGKSLQNKSHIVTFVPYEVVMDGPELAKIQETNRKIREKQDRIRSIEYKLQDIRNNQQHMVELNKMMVTLQKELSELQQS